MTEDVNTALRKAPNKQKKPLMFQVSDRLVLAMTLVIFTRGNLHENAALINHAWKCKHTFHFGKVSWMFTSTVPVYFEMTAMNYLLSLDYYIFCLI